MRRSIGYVAMGSILAISLACGVGGEDSEEAEPTDSIRILSATYGTSLTQSRVTQPVQEFQPTDTVCISVEIEGRPRSGIVKLRWPLGGQNVDVNVDLASANANVFSIGGSTSVGGRLTHTLPLPAGNYETIVFYNDTEVGRYPFRVVGPPLATEITGPYTSAPSGTMPPVVNPLPAGTSVFHLAWSHPNLPANERVTLALVAVEVGAAAAPMTTVSSAEVTAGAVAGPYSAPAEFSLPRPWPTGSYRVTATGSTLGQFATLDFNIQ